MTPENQLEWEARAGRWAAYAAFASVALLVGSGLYLQLALSGRPDDADEFFETIDRQPFDFILSGVLQGLGTALLAVVLWFLYRATRSRRPEIPKVALILAVTGPLLAGLIGVVRQVEIVNVASNFLSADFPTNVGEITDAQDYLEAVDPKERAEADLREGNLAAISGIGLGANVALGFGLVLVMLHAMRAGLVSRFLGYLGIIIGVLYVLPIGAGPILQVFWLGSLGLLFLNRWPGGRGPAWQTGEAIPWPSAGEQREEIQRRREEREGEGEAAEEPEDEETGPPRRKRKRRR